MPSSDRLAYFHEALCHVLRHAELNRLESLWGRRPPSYGLWSVLGTLSQCTADHLYRGDTTGLSAGDAGAEPSMQTDGASPSLDCNDDDGPVPTVFCEAPSQGDHDGRPKTVPLSAVLPSLKELVRAAKADLGELAVFWARTGSKAARGQLLRTWG